MHSQLYINSIELFSVSLNENDNLFKHVLKTKDDRIIAVTSKGAVYDVHSNTQIEKPSNSLVYDAIISDNNHLILTFHTQALKEICLHHTTCDISGIREEILNSIEFNITNKSIKALH